MMTRISLHIVRLVGYLPLSWLRGLGWLLGHALYVGIAARRRVVLVNLCLCFPHWPPTQIRRCARRTFVCFAQAWLDRGWLWYGAPEKTRRRLQLTGAVQELAANEPTVLFAPHFVGMDAGWTTLTQQLARSFITIYTNQANLVSNEWILQGRKRFANGRLFGRIEGVKPILAALKKGEPLYLLPDMNFGPQESVFVPFYGVPAATVPSLSRFAKLGRAKVVPIVTRLTPKGYEVRVLPAWQDFPSDDLVADTVFMNLRLQGYIDEMPEQYYWVHKRFKDRPNGEAAPY